MSETKTLHGLSYGQLEIIRGILCPYARHIDMAGLFGSRATGTYRDNSDIDLVLYGDLSIEAVDRIRTLFDDSSLPVKVDVSSYNRVKYPPLKQHIDEVMLTIFTREELTK